MNLSDEQWFFLLDLAKLINYIESQGDKATGGELLRTPEQQEIYLNAGKSLTKDSRHLQKLAIDLNIFVKGNYTIRKEDLQKYGDYWEGLNPQNSWGGAWKLFLDTVHFQREIK